MTTGPRLALPKVTLCAATSVNVPATIEALERCLRLASFSETLLFTDDRSDLGETSIRRIEAERMKGSADYSRFMLRDLVEHIRTDHVLVVQWDGFIIDAGAWDDDYLSYDYIGAPWPQFSDGHDVGNGGFSLRSKRLLEACLDPAFVHADPEDVAVCRINRAMLEEKHGIRFAPRPIADNFAFERTRPLGSVFGFHGIFNMIEAIGEEEFWKLYSSLDERSTAARNARLLWEQLGKFPYASRRRAALIWNRLAGNFSRR
jgi:hypothetical protein